MNALSAFQIVLLASEFQYYYPTCRSRECLMWVAKLNESDGIVLCFGKGFVRKITYVWNKNT